MVKKKSSVFKNIQEFIFQLWLHKSLSTNNTHRVQIMRGGPKATVTWTKLLTTLQSLFPPKRLLWPPSYKWQKPLQNEQVSILGACKVAEGNRKTGRISLLLKVGFTFVLHGNICHVTLRCLRLREKCPAKSWIQMWTKFQAGNEVSCSLNVIFQYIKNFS